MIRPFWIERPWKSLALSVFCILASFYGVYRSVSRDGKVISSYLACPSTPFVERKKSLRWAIENSPMF